MDTINVRVRQMDKLSKLQDAAALRAGATRPVRTATINQLHQDLLADQVYLVRSETDQVLVTTDELLQEIREGTNVFLIAFETETLDDVVALLKENLEIMRPYKAAMTPKKTCLKRSVDNLERDKLKKSK